MTRVSPVKPPRVRLSPLFIWSLLWLGVLGTFFFWSYTLANSITSRRAHVPAIAFGWEHLVPFIPWSIFPYWTSDLLYAVSFFICQTRRELNVHVKRLFAAQLISIVCFLMFPLRCIFVRPETSGFPGWMFQVLLGFDKPFNQAPSLHVSLAVILWSLFSAHLTGHWRRVMTAWLIIVAISTMTTYQHQFIDLPTGLLAGLLAIALFPESTDFGAREQRLRIGIFYLSGAVFLISGALKTEGLGWTLLWPAASLLWVALAYVSDRPGLLGARAAAFVLAPYTAAAWINSRYWTRNNQPQEIRDGVWIGRVPGWLDRDSKTFHSVVDLSPELRVRAQNPLHRKIAILDLVIPSLGQLEDAVSAIENFREDRPTLVCCALGFSRSVAAVAAWLVWTGRAKSGDEAMTIVRSRRSKVVIRAATVALIDDSFIRASPGEPSVRQI